MREMHKWKDKVEFRLDNRQIFFLFFGLSVVGCFVFALGVMVGRRVDFADSGEVAALSEDSLALLEGSGDPPQALSFKDGLATPATEGLPPTRDPRGPTLLPADPAAPIAGQKGQNDRSKTMLASTLAPKSKPAAAPTPAKSKASVQSKKKSEPKASGVMSGASKDLRGKPTPGRRRFTLQMKAFAKKSAAEAFAAPLRENGHDVRIEAHEVKGRVWHRVRVGAFDSWEDGLAAKTQFEKSEKIIAYVMQM